ncbi:hypothetical protein [Colwellia sp. Bg11-28]|uniref:hypothetical protein n=1 Tax=Colwellia sp. Bg11-28 TaxID=2058305 RepID=UPI000C325B79|nr:hypothetical protein [Colwellia sp. Bg11-28]PKH86990.1 hypothetical protein CXF79_09695 [Colwellia sp. Bg11-28]
MSSQELKNKNLDESLHLKVDIRTEATISSTQEDFPLCEADFIRLKNGKAKGLDIAITFFLTSLGSLILFGAKYLASILDNKLFVYESWEWIAPLIAAVISIVIYISSTIIPNDRKRVWSAIEAHFKKAPRIRHIKGANHD